MGNADARAHKVAGESLREQKVSEVACGDEAPEVAFALCRTKLEFSIRDETCIYQLAFSTVYERFTGGGQWHFFTRFLSKLDSHVLPVIPVRYAVVTRDVICDRGVAAGALAVGDFGGAHKGPFKFAGF